MTRYKILFIIELRLIDGLSHERKCVMGFFDKLVEMKKEHDRKVAYEQEMERQKRIQRETEAAEREKEILDKLESSGLMNLLVKWMSSYEWFAHSQGSWDKNRRQIIVTPVNLFLNNYDEDTFFNILEDVAMTGKDQITYSLKRDYQGAVTPWGEIIRAPTKETMENDDILERYKESSGYDLLVGIYEAHGYSPIYDKEALKNFSKAMRNVLKRTYPMAVFSDIHQNAFGFWAFELTVPRGQQRSII